MKDAENTFAYSWCMTDHKDGTEIRRDWRKADYILDEPYATCLKDMLEKLGLPQPTYKDVFRGTRHDLLFLTSHGVVLRIGPTDVTKLISPGVVQPLGWMESKDLKIGNLPFTVAIYPGVELPHLVKGLPKVGDLRAVFKHANQQCSDMNAQNTGYISVANDHKDTVGVQLVIDIDNEFLKLEEASAKKVADCLEDFKKKPGNLADAVSHTMQYLYHDIPNVKYYMSAFDTHQPLREMFWDAFRDTDAPDTAARDKFWDTCALLTNNPQKVVYPLWRMEKDAEGKPTFKREEVRIHDLSLRTPWTHNPGNKVFTPISFEVLAEKQKKREERRKAEEEAAEERRRQRKIKKAEDDVRMHMIVMAYC